MEKKKVGFSWLALSGLALMICGCPVTRMATHDNTITFIVGFVGIVLFGIALYTNRLRVFG